MSQPEPTIHIEILNPRDQTEVSSNHIVQLRASASAGSENLDGQIRWRSSRDGFLGQGGDVPVQLTAGQHTLRAFVRLSEGTRSRSSRRSSQTSQESQTDSGDFAKDVVEVNAVPVDYPGGDT
ncbi:MAG: hypothetical protein MI919_37060 [Holophagales bacterium]|nr:hypothetical protein [Holophagales bacterium]